MGGVELTYYNSVPWHIERLESDINTDGLGRVIAALVDSVVANSQL